MRVTNNMMTSNLLYNVNRNLEYMSKRQDELATGKKIHSPSDDPVLASKILARRTDLAEMEQYDKNTRDAIGWLEITEKALEDNGNIFQRIRELTVQAANGTNTAEDTQKIKLEIEQLKNQLITNANTTYAGRYVFSGFETDKKLMNEDGTYNIDVTQYALNSKPVVKYEVQVGESMDVMTNGLDIYGSVSEKNVMTKYFPGGVSNTIAFNNGISSTKSLLTRNFDTTADYTAATLDVTITAPPVYNVDESVLDGSSVEMTKQHVIDTYKAASNGVNTLGDVANVYFNADDQLVIEMNAYGATPMSATGSTATLGSTKTEATLSGLPIPALSTEDITHLRKHGLTIAINGDVKNIKPAQDAIFTDVTGYVANMQIQIDKAFGAGKVSITEVGGTITFATVGTPDGVQPKISVDYSRTKTSQMMEDIDELLTHLEAGDHAKLTEMLETIDLHKNNMLALRADIGARTNRMEMISKKISANNVSFTQLLSDAQDADMSEVIMKLKNAENVYKASLNTGARVIQPSLIDFLR